MCVRHSFTDWPVDSWTEEMMALPLLIGWWEKWIGKKKARDSGLRRFFFLKYNRNPGPSSRFSVFRPASGLLFSMWTEFYHGVEQRLSHVVWSSQRAYFLRFLCPTNRLINGRAWKAKTAFVINLEIARLVACYWRKERVYGFWIFRILLVIIIGLLVGK